MPDEREERWDPVIAIAGYHDTQNWPDTEGLDVVRKRGLALHAKWWNSPEYREEKGNGTSSGSVHILPALGTVGKRSKTLIKIDIDVLVPTLIRIYPNSDEFHYYIYPMHTTPLWHSSLRLSQCNTGTATTRPNAPSSGTTIRRAKTLTRPERSVAPVPLIHSHPAIVPDSGYNGSQA
ncbi:hypothetical protein DFJ43DRAFT_1043181 [Lentinula guzmanii]|uniref:Uncharacterized protein n=1 Tax=Lentinula guzmanii TaxID=2804957 RepID=A0AA38J9Y0_9AGAR|nr:hypothetical protein DFJ43DRAFT_1043181 [Lentinula guzmanii]